MGMGLFNIDYVVIMKGTVRRIRWIDEINNVLGRHLDNQKREIFHRAKDQFTNQNVDPGHFHSPGGEYDPVLV